MQKGLNSNNNRATLCTMQRRHYTGCSATDRAQQPSQSVDFNEADTHS